MPRLERFMLQLCVWASALLVNDEFGHLGHIASIRGNSDVCPTIKLTNDLLVRQTAGDDGTHHLVRGHAGHANVGGTTTAVIAGVFAAHGGVYGF